MTFKELAARITGVNFPVFGVSWNPPVPDITVARRVLSFLEDRRVLYAPESMELPSACVQSVQEIRRYLTTQLETAEPGGFFAETLKTMRRACREFLTAVQQDPTTARLARHIGHYQSWYFFTALGHYRATMGLHLARMATAYGLELDDTLAQIVPLGSPEDN